MFLVPMVSQDAVGLLVILGRMESSVILGHLGQVGMMVLREQEDSPDEG